MTRLAATSVPSRRRVGALLALLPLWAVAVALAWQAPGELEASRGEQTRLTARLLAATLDRELASIDSELHALAADPGLEPAQRADLHRVASDRVKRLIANNVVLMDDGFRQHLNTLQPWGVPLPAPGGPPAFKRLFTERASIVTGVFKGPLSGTFVVAVAIPAVDAAGRVWCLGAGISPSRLSQLLTQQELPVGWVAAVVDDQGRIVARSREGARFVGQDAVPPLLQAMAREPRGTLRTLSKEGVEVLTSYTPLQRANWRVAVGAPVSELQALQARVFGALAAATLLSLLGLWLLLRRPG